MVVGSMNGFYFVIALGLLSLSARHSGAALAYTFREAIVDAEAGVARIDLVAIPSPSQLKAASTLGTVGQHTSTIRFDLLGDLTGESVGVSVSDRLTNPESLFFTPTNGHSTISTGQQQTYTVISLGGVPFHSLVQNQTIVPLLTFEFSLGEFFSKKPIAGGIKLTVEDLGSPSPTSLGNIGNIEAPFAGDPLFAVAPSGGDLDAPVSGASQTLFILSNLVGDLNGDAIVNAIDIDILSMAIAGDETLDLFDLNNDTTVSGDDLAFLVKDLLDTRSGDANLDGEVDFGDFLLLSRSFGQPGTWADGDFNGNGEVDFPDFLILSSNYGKPRSVPVPESDHVNIAFLGWILLLVTKRGSRGSA